MRAPALLLALLVSGCGLPLDPEDTLARVQAGGPLRVGLSESPPLVVSAAEAPRGLEPALVRELAAETGARVVWVAGSSEVHLAALSRHELDLVIGGLEADSPWGGRVGLTRPYRTTRQGGRQHRHVLAVPPGENAWLLYLERFLDRWEGAQ